MKFKNWLVDKIIKSEGLVEKVNKEVKKLDWEKMEYKIDVSGLDWAKDWEPIEMESGTIVHGSTGTHISASGSPFEGVTPMGGSWIYKEYMDAYEPKCSIKEYKGCSKNK